MLLLILATMFQVLANKQVCRIILQGRDLFIDIDTQDESTNQLN